MAKTKNNKHPAKGTSYCKKNDQRLAPIIKECLFITIPHRKYRNELRQDCIIHEPDPKTPQYLAELGENDFNKDKPGKKKPHKKYIFVQCTNKAPFIYMGEMKYCVYYDKGRNQLHYK